MTIDLDLFATRAALYGASPLDDYALFAARRDFMADHRLDEDTVFAAVHVFSVMPLWFDADRFDLDEIEGVEPVVAGVCEVLDKDGEMVVDLIAWPIDRPNQIASFTGRSAMLGAAGLFRHDAESLYPLKIARTVGGWLQTMRDGRDAILPIKMMETARELILVDGRYEAEDDAHGLEIQAAMASLVDVSRIVVADRRREAA